MRPTDTTTVTPVDWHRDTENAPTDLGLLVVWNKEDADAPFFYWDAAYRNEKGEWLTFDGSFDKILGEPIAWAYPPSRLVLE